MTEVSAFDPAAFLESTTSEALVRRPPLPVENPSTDDKLYTAVIGEPKVRTWVGKTDSTKSGLAMDIPLVVSVPPELQDSMKLPAEVTLTDGFIVDLTASGSMDTAPGRNRRLRIYREATGLNKAGEPFAPRMLQGQVVKVKVTHEVYNDDIMDRVGNVLKS